MTSVSEPVTVCPPQTRAALALLRVTSAAEATPRLVKPLGAEACEVMMPEPFQPPPLRPVCTRPLTPSYTPAVGEPTGVDVISLLSERSILLPAPVTLTDGV